ncbi:MAG: D-alanyl-D-alanine carboxypeptidase family protein [Desulfobacca sp.]|uniref:D-alanyl-D-alanine carboxypeptidase family protein n=1 Tax=Desulfobacca sp. TaxID=2067990 RepID=UPI0040492605
MGRRLLVALVAILSAWAAGPVVAQETAEEVKAKAYYIIDADTGRLLAAANPQMMLPPASTLKVATALIAVNSLRLTDRVTVSAHAAAAPPSKINIRPGETYSVEDMLYAVLLASANDAARALAERVSGSEEAFAQFMTARLRALGAYRTNFRNASGLPAPGQFSTAQDLAHIFRLAMQNPTIAKILAAKSHLLTDGKVVRSHNRFLFSSEYAVAGKTGFTRASQHTYVGMFQNGDRRIIVSLLGSPNKWPDLRLLIAKGFAAAGTPIAALPPLEERLRKTSNGYSLMGDDLDRSAGGQIRAKKRPSGHRYQRESASRHVIRASVTPTGSEISRTSKKKVSKNKPPTKNRVTSGRG